MRLHSIRIRNYKCFWDSGDIEFSSGFNVVVGRNDVGKSALVEALSLDFSNKPHRSVKTVPVSGAVTNGLSTVSHICGLSAVEMNDWLSREQYIDMYVGVVADQAALLGNFISKINEDGEFCAVRSGDDVLQIASLKSYLGPTEGNFFSYKNVDYPGKFNPQVCGSRSDVINTFEQLFSRKIKDLSYAFKAERLNIGECHLEGSNKLKSNASNLADVLNQLISSNPARSQKLMEHMRTVFPHIAHVTANVLPQSTSARINVMSGAQDSERADLAVPLSDSGTGIGQVLAMLYVVLTSEIPQIIVIDEPQSFLHPGALRKFLEILRMYPKHQYIITTHSPLAIDPTANDRFFLMSKSGSESKIEVINPKSQQDFQLFLSEVGARLSDVFGADTVLWVEGKTEEVCFPEIIRRIGKVQLRGVQILGVISTDELGAKMASRVFDIYNKLSTTSSLLPPALAFIFDKEGRSARELEDIDKKSGGLLRWLPCRMYENYLLESEILTNLINAEDVSRSVPCKEEEIQNWIMSNFSDKKYWVNGVVSTTFENEGRFDAIDGAKLLKDLFNHFTETRVSYDKVSHGYKLTLALIDKPTPKLIELGKFLSDLVNTQGK